MNTILYIFSEMCPILGKKSMTDHQLEILTNTLNANPYPGIKERHQLSKSLNTSQTAIRDWFNYKRRKKSKDAIQKISE